MVCEGHIQQIDISWNYPYTILEKAYYDRIWRFNSKKEYLKYLAASKNPKQVHFYTGQKAWDYPEFSFSPYFWIYARQTPFYERILFASKALSSNQNPVIERVLFPQISIVFQIEENLQETKAFLDSCENQTYKNFEIICIASHRAKESLKECLSRAGENTKIHVLRYSSQYAQLTEDIVRSEAFGRKILWTGQKNPLSDKDILKKMLSNEKTPFQFLPEK